MEYLDTYFNDWCAKFTMIFNFLEKLKGDFKVGGKTE